MDLCQAAQVLRDLCLTHLSGYLMVKIRFFLVKVLQDSYEQPSGVDSSRYLSCNENRSW